MLSKKTRIYISYNKVADPEPGCMVYLQPYKYYDVNNRTSGRLCSHNLHLIVTTSISLSLQ